MELQKDLNIVTISSVQAGKCVANFISAYSGMPCDDMSLCVRHMTTALESLVKAMGSTVNDINEIARLIDDKG